MSRRFLPVREAELDDWLANFAGKLTAAPGVYGLTAGDAAVISSAVAVWHAAYVAAAGPSTRTAATVQQKRNTKRAVTTVVRSAAARIRSNNTVASELKIGLGLVLRTAGGSPIPVPGTRPVLGLRKMDTGVHILSAHDIVSGRGGKPERTAGLVVFRAVGASAARSPEEDGGGENAMSYLGLFTRPRFTSAFTAADRGKTATYFARWVNAKGEPGPWSLALSIAIAA